MHAAVAAVYDRRQTGSSEIAGGPRSASAIARSLTDRPPLQLAIALLMAVLIAALCVSCSKAQTAQAEDLSVPDAPTVAVTKATVENISRGIVLTAEFRPFQEVDVMAKIAGYVKKINVYVGD